MYTLISRNQYYDIPRKVMLSIEFSLSHNNSTKSVLLLTEELAQDIHHPLPFIKL